MFTCCKACFLNKRKKKPRNKRVAGNSREGSPGRSPDREQQEVHAYYIGAASTMSTVVATEDHPRLDVKVTFPTPQGSRDMRVVGAVADTGAQVNIFPARLLQESGLQLFSVMMSKLPNIKSASGARMRVTGAAVCYSNERREVYNLHKGLHCGLQGLLLVVQRNQGPERCQCALSRA